MNATDDALRFIRTLRQLPNHQDALVSWETVQTYSDVNKEDKASACHRRGTLSMMTEVLAAWNGEGRAIHIMINHSTGAGRSKRHVGAIVGVWADLDAKDATEKIELDQCPLRPTMAVASSPEGRHVYWLLLEPLEVTPENIFRVEALMRAIVAALEKWGADPSCAEISRVLRVPGYVNNKPQHGGHVVTLLWDDGPRYSIEEIEEKFLPLAEALQPGITSRQPYEGGGTDNSWRDAFRVEDENGVSHPVDWKTFNLILLLKDHFGIQAELRGEFYDCTCPWPHDKPNIRQAWARVPDDAGPSFGCWGKHFGMGLREICELVGPEVVAEYAQPRTSELDGQDPATLTFGSGPIPVYMPLPLKPIETTEILEPVNGLKIEDLMVSGPVPAVSSIDRKYAETPGCLALIQRREVTREEEDPETKVKKEITEWETYYRTLCDFVPTIREENLVHDGEDTFIRYKVDAVTAAGKNLKALDVPAKDFAAMKWLDEWGADISITQGWPRNLGSVTGNIKEAIVERKKVFPPSHCEVWDHIGWRCINGEQVYLHAKGGISKDGLVPGLVVDTGVNSPLKDYFFTSIPTGEELRDCIGASLRIMDVTADVCTVPLLLSTYRATLPVIPDWGVHDHGETGSGKSTGVALVQGHWNPKSTKNSLAGSWISTAASLEALCHQAKNAIVCIDDANQSVKDIAQKMERVLRANGNGTSRGRMTATMRSQRNLSPRAMVLSTGEDLPEGHSCRSRVFLVDTPPLVRPNGDNSLLDRLQQEVRDGKMNKAMAAWLKWLAPQVNQILEDWNKWLIKERQTLNMSLLQAHGRSVDQVAEFLITGKLLLRWAQEVGAITAEESNAYWNRFVLAFNVLAEDQRTEQAAEDPIKKFFLMIPDLVQGGHCHLASESGTVPENPSVMGWEGSGYEGEWKPKGLCIGKVVGEKVYLNKTTVLSLVVEQSRRMGASFAVSPGTFWKRLKPYLVKGDGKNIGVKMGAKVAEGFDSSYAPCVLMASFPQWSDLKAVPASPQLDPVGKWGSQFPMVLPALQVPAAGMTSERILRDIGNLLD